MPIPMRRKLEIVQAQLKGLIDLIEDTQIRDILLGTVRNLHAFELENGLYTFPSSVLDFIFQDEKIRAIKELRERTGLGLKEAKEAVDAKVDELRRNRDTRYLEGQWLSRCGDEFRRIQSQPARREAILTAAREPFADMEHMNILWGLLNDINGLNQSLADALRNPNDDEAYA